MKEIKNFSNAIPVNMWTFAEAIEKEMKRHGINKKNGKTIK